jgi:DNA polymerase elongation subunit (family B)
VSAPKILTLDIETFPILAWTFSTKNAFIGPSNIVKPAKMVSWAAKWYRDPEVRFMSEFHDGRKPMVKGIKRLIDEADIVVTYNGKSFDIPHINREVEVLKLGVIAPFQHIDLYHQVRRTFRFSTSNLDEVVTELGLGKKVEHEGFALWLKCIAGDPEAWARFQEYNMHDVVLTERLLDRILAWGGPGIPNFGLWVDEARPICPKPNCGSPRMQRRGTAQTNVSRFQRYQCQACGGWSRGGTRVNAVDQRGIS